MRTLDEILEEFDKVVEGAAPEEKLQTGRLWVELLKWRARAEIAAARLRSMW